VPRRDLLSSDARSPGASCWRWRRTAAPPCASATTATASGPPRRPLFTAHYRMGNGRGQRRRRHAGLRRSPAEGHRGSQPAARRRRRRPEPGGGAAVRAAGVPQPASGGHRGGLRPGRRAPSRGAARRRHDSAGPGAGTVFVTVDRIGGRAVDAAFEAELRDHLGPSAWPATTSRSTGRASVPLDLELFVCVEPGYRRATSGGAAATLGSAALPDGRRGFFHPDEPGPSGRRSS
jgi:hypothetical protein